MEIGKKEKLAEAWKEYKKSKQNAKRDISLGKGKKQKECASDLNDPNKQNDFFRIAKQTLKERQDIMGVKHIIKTTAWIPAKF